MTVLPQWILFCPSSYRFLEKRIKKLLITSEFMTEQANDPYCREITSTVSTSWSTYWCDRDRVLTIQSRIGGALQKAVSSLLHAGVLYLSRCLVVAGRHCKKNFMRLFNSNITGIQWPMIQTWRSKLFVFRRVGHKSPSWETTTSVFSRWTAWLSVNSHSGCIIKD